MNGFQINNLAEYNYRRRQMLPHWEIPIPPEGEELNEEEAVEQANTLVENRCTGNLEISLFWEEKIIILVRVLQLYSVFYLYYYEYWPSKTRDQLTPYFSLLLVAWYVPTQNHFYAFITDFDKVWLTTCIYVGALVLCLILLSSFRCQKKLKYRMEFVYVDSCNWMRWIFLALEILYVPLLVNATWAGNCQFMTKRAAVIVTECGKNSEIQNEVWYYWGLKGGAIFALLTAVGYNMTLYYIIQSEKISVKFHELAVQKKEVEYAIGINKVWNNSKFYTFSSFNSGVTHMYHRIVFNMVPVLLALGNMLLVSQIH